MRRLFYLLLTIPGIIAMEKEKDKQQESPAKQSTATSQDSVNELISQAFSFVIRANELYDQARVEKIPEIFNGSNYEKAQNLYIKAHDLFFQADTKGHEYALGMAYLTYERKIVPIEGIKVRINPAYSTSPAWIKAAKKQEGIQLTQSELKKILNKIPTDWLKAFEIKELNPKELITWWQALDEVKNKPIPEEKHHKKDKGK
jgi:hypothetical protein